MMYTSLWETVMRNVVKSNFFRLWWVVMILTMVAYHIMERREVL